MKKHPTRRHRAAAGFSLIELLAVLVIMAILAGIVAVKFVGQSKDAKVAAARTQMVNFKTALDRYELNMGGYPESGEGLKALVEKPADDNGNWKGPYLDATGVPKDQWGHDWNYRNPGDHRPDSYDLWSNGPDGQEGGGDDICNWDEAK